MLIAASRQMSRIRGRCPASRITGRRRTNTTTKQSASWQDEIGITSTRPSLGTLLIRPTLFSATVCLGSFGSAAIYRYEQQLEEERRRKEQKKSLWHVFRKALNKEIRTRGIKITRQKNKEDEEDIAADWLSYLPSAYLQTTLQPWLQSAIDFFRTESRRPQAHSVGPLLASNVALHLLFQIPGLGPFVKYRYFCHFTNSGRGLPMLLSTFAHSGLIHLGFNMSCLWTFGQAVTDLLGSREQFWAAYVSAGTLASLGNIVIEGALRNARNIPMIGGLGASGALSAGFAAFCLYHPDALLCVPGVTSWVPAEGMLTYFVMFDSTMLLLHAITRTNLLGLGHGAHLSGVAVGYTALECKGLDLVEDYQDRVVKIYAAQKSKLLGEE